MSNKPKFKITDIETNRTFIVTIEEGNSDDFLLLIMSYSDMTIEPYVD